jgi:RHS repeat-associated protein
VSNNQVTATSFLVFGGEMVALATEASTAPGTITTVWQLKDHLGSTTTLLNSSGQLSGARKGYDVWGKRRHVTGADDASNSITSGSNRDYTGHEYLEEIRLVHMNGRIYDPVVARFLSPDPFIDNPLDLQSLNRYTYVNNNPLAYTDPSGYFKIGKFFSRAFGGVQKFLQRNPIAALAVGLAVAWATGGILNFEFFTWQSALVAGTVSGGLTGGLKGAIYGAASGLITAGIGELGLSALEGGQFLAKALLHGGAQGALAEAQGGEFGPAFLAASFSHAAGHFVKDIPGIQGRSLQAVVGQTAAGAVIGGTAAVIGGGKFQNGAATGAFVTLFNQLSESGRDPNERHEMGVRRSIADYENRGYEILSRTPVAVSVPGFETPRFYDFLVRDPIAGQNIGIEVKTTLFDTIRLDTTQVMKDVALMTRGGGLATGSGIIVRGVGYTTYCWGCGVAPNLRSAALRDALSAAQIPFQHGGRPGELRVP